MDGQEIQLEQSLQNSTTNSKKNETTCIESSDPTRFMKKQRKAETAHLRIHQVQEKDQSISAQTCKKKKKTKTPINPNLQILPKVHIPLSVKNTI